jgi:type II secretory pathway pseudopilin PulG
MLVATFGPTTAWVGKTISWDGHRFVLEGYGPVPAAALVDYDQHGHLQWASADLRSWAWAYAHWEASGAAAAMGAAQPQAAQPWVATRPALATAPAGGKKPFPAWAIVLIVAAVLLPVGGLFAAIAVPTFLMQQDKAHESAVKEGFHSIQVGIQTWAVDHQNTYPPASEVNPTAMSKYVDWWPTNPYIGEPMTQGTQPGDFFYAVAPDGSWFRLVGYGENGKVIIDTGSTGPTI